MAASAIIVWFSLTIFSAFVLIISASTDQPATSGDFNTTALDDQSFIYNATDNYTTTDLPKPPTTTPTPSYSSTEPVPPAEPLPVSGSLLTPVTDVGRLCPCDDHQDVCDMNCCCDRKCKEEESLFTRCSVGSVRGSRQLCERDVASYTLRTKIDGYSELTSSVQKETNYDVFCIQSQNRVDGLSHPSPTLPTESNFEELFKQFTSFIFGSVSSDKMFPAEVQASSGYQFGDVMLTAGDGEDGGMLYLPAAAVTADCVNSPAAFLKDQRSRCSRRVVLDQDCSSLPGLNMNTYTNIQLSAGKKTDAAVVPVEVKSIILQSAEGTQTELTISGGEDLRPVLLRPTLCANVVLKVVYVIKYTSAGYVVNATVSLVLGFIRQAAVLLEQEFQLTFIQENGGDMPVQYSGNPGYVVGMPLVSGTRTTNGISRSLDLRDTLSVLHSSPDQDCLQGPHRRSPVLFGLDSVSGCTLRLEDTNCSLVSQLVLDVLRGPDYPQYVASFGNSPLESPLDWIQIRSLVHPSDSPGCSIPLSRHLEVEWTKYGSLLNPQAQIVSIREVIQTNTSSLTVLSSSSILPVSSSVAFIPASAAAVPGYRATPTIDAKLPFDFFFPFV
ncbi:tectonic-1 [Melanotaenia boesemani]|uniref:tectonic-1 n=1 Tax=Melanotaenia boesemani TaxID=1250792 RepID=UPI001C051FE3|nr:tectonic-1 [Melanotaenia boesemani]